LVAAWFLVMAAMVGWAGVALAFETEAKNAILMDYKTGAMLFGKGPDERIPPASMSKLMTALVVFDRLREGRLKLEDELPVSEKAWRTGGSKMFVKVGDRVSVDLLLRGLIVQSGNDACVVLAEALAGSEQAFAEQMTERAKEIGLTNSHFANVTGLPDPEQWMSVRDLALVARYIIMNYPEYYPMYSQTEFTYANIRQFNRNPLLQKGVPGVDGMKTGHTEEAGYGLVSSAIRNGHRLILVIADNASPRMRATEGERLLEYGFRDFQEYKLFGPNESVQDADVWMGSQSRIPLVAPDGVAVTMSREARKDMVVKLVYQTPVPAPIAAGQVLAELQVTAPGFEPVAIPLVAPEAVAEAGLFGRMTGALGYLIWGRS
jgi:D-alanyl-D-alanine carboxypeptidase (penicillin-binding protein 5/6)